MSCYGSLLDYAIYEAVDLCHQTVSNCDIILDHTYIFFLW